MPEPEIIIHRLDPICDFCSSPDVVVGYLIEDFVLPEYGWGSKGGFAACEICKTLIESKQYAALEQRAYNRFVNHFGDLVSAQMARTFIHRLHTEFWKRYLRVHAGKN